jgi:predicted acylesterase/phospholipase RssA
MKEAVVLSGGGGFAAYEVGVLKGLFEMHPEMRPEIFTGASAGSYNAALMVSLEAEGPQAAAGHLERVWMERIAAHPRTFENGVFRLRGDFPRYLDALFSPNLAVEPFIEMADDASFFAQDILNRATHALFSRGSLSRRAFELVDLTAFFSAEPMHNLIKETIDFARIREARTQLSVAATDWLTGAIKTFRNADMTDETGHLAIAASSAIPGIFPPVELNGRHYADGGVLVNTPLAPAIRAGADVLHVVYLSPEARDVPLPGMRNTVDTLERLLIIGTSGRITADIDNLRRINRTIREGGSTIYAPLTVHRYHPKKSLGGVLGLLDFRKSRVAQLIERGYRDALEHDERYCEENGCVLPLSAGMVATARP